MYGGLSRPSRIFIREQLPAEIINILCPVYGVLLTGSGQLRLLDLRKKAGEDVRVGRPRGWAKERPFAMEFEIVIK